MHIQVLVDADAWGLKHQAFCIHSAEQYALHRTTVILVRNIAITVNKIRNATLKYCSW